MNPHWTAVLPVALVALVPATGCAPWQLPATTASATPAQPEVVREVVREVVYQPQTVYVERPAAEPRIVNTVTTGEVNVSVASTGPRRVVRYHRPSPRPVVCIQPRIGFGLRRVLRVIAPRHPSPPRHGPGKPGRGPGRERERGRERGREHERERGGRPGQGPPRRPQRG
ncbi:MAG: hypothetical protein R6X12_09865 [bacterium]